MIPTLYRGDSLPNSALNHNDPKVRGKTWAEFYITEGLVAKFASGGAEGIWEHGLPFLVATHIGYMRDPDPQKLNLETFVYNKSPFISFSTDMNRAFHFMKRNKNARFEPCNLENASHFVWSLSGLQCHEHSPGQHAFTFKASNENVMVYLNEIEADLARQALDPDALDLNDFGPKLGKLIAAEHTRTDDSQHKAELIDALTFLQHNSDKIEDKALLQRALNSAGRSSEWLLWPKDPFELSYSAKFPLNRHLKLDHWARRVRGA